MDIYCNSNVGTPNSNVLQFRYTMRDTLDAAIPTPSPIVPVTVSESTCEDLGWVNADIYGSTSVCGESDLGLGGCSGALRWSEARAFCEDAGARLCTVAELAADEARGTGCGTR